MSPSLFNFVGIQFFAPEAAINLVDKLDRAISNLQQFPFSGQHYRSSGWLKDNYRMLAVESYLVFYVVMDDVVEIRRIIYGRRDYDKLL